MEDSDEEELLNLSLSVAANRERKEKGKCTTSSSSSTSVSSIMTNPSYEAKIFMLLQTRDHMMLRQQQINHHTPGVPLIHLLLTTATAIDNNAVVDCALDHLTDLYRTASLTGDSVQRVVAYFTDALTAKLLTPKSPFYHLLIDEPTTEESFLAFTDLYRVSPYYQFAHFTANQSILETFENEEYRNNRALHVIDFDVSYGFQWPSLIQSLSEKATAGNRISLRITGFGNNLKELQETESRLVSFANGFSNNLVFEFQGLLRGARVVNLRKKKNETVAVNLVSFSYYWMTVTDTLEFVHSLNPSVVVLVEGNRSGYSRRFLTRLTESLHYFAAMFDSLDDCLPSESVERLRIERKLLGREIKSVLSNNGNCGNSNDDVGNIDDENNNNKWIERMESHGFGVMKISSKSVIQAKLLLKMRTHCCRMQFEEESGGFRVSEREQATALSLAWQNRFLLTVSAWQPLSSYNLINYS